MKYRACRISLPPVLSSQCWRLVSDQSWMATGQHKPAEQVAEVIGDDAEEKPDLVGPEPMAGEARPMCRGLAFLDPLLGRPTLVVEADDRPVRPP